MSNDALIATLARFVEGGELIETGLVAWIDSSALLNRRATLILTRILNGRTRTGTRVNRERDGLSVRRPEPEWEPIGWVVSSEFGISPSLLNSHHHLNKQLNPFAHRLYPHGQLAICSPCTGNSAVLSSMAPADRIFAPDRLYQISLTLKAGDSHSQLQPSTAQGHTNAPALIAHHCRKQGLGTTTCTTTTHPPWRLRTLRGLRVAAQPTTQDGELPHLNNSTITLTHSSTTTQGHPNFSSTINNHLSFLLRPFPLSKLLSCPTGMTGETHLPNTRPHPHPHPRPHRPALSHPPRHPISPHQSDPPLSRNLLRLSQPPRPTTTIGADGTINPRRPARPTSPPPPVPTSSAPPSPTAALPLPTLSFHPPRLHPRTKPTKSSRPESTGSTATSSQESTTTRSRSAWTAS